ncbi:MAG: aminotransferase class I/II-fold pyridoxal phosphate-dependent enzyme [Bryobacterales bacterium]|nr:aminotransferase class I/II-fold pyridoxal phosphate-dependent enzyme [Bryobacterales bacterium]
MNVTHGGNIFAVAAQHGWDWRDIADFSASINPLGPSPHVRPAIERALDRIVHYPEADAGTLVRALAELWSVPPASVLAGNGATDLIHFFARMLRTDRVYLAAPVFSEFHRVYPRATIVPFDAKQWPRDGLLIVTRPANPTGALPDLHSYLGNAPNPVLVDESFLEFTGQPSLSPLAARRENLFVLRSLTKFYALPGLRIGALVANSSVLAEWRKSREPWQVNVLAEQAALAAIADQEHATRTVEFITREREWLHMQLSRIPGIEPQPSNANYLLVKTQYEAAPLARHMLAAKILIRDCSGWAGVPVPHAVRLAVRPREENERLLDAWRHFRP